MYKEMRRKDRTMEKEKMMEILKNNEYGFMSTVSEDGQPYITPLSYVMIENDIYFHCARAGQKLDNINFEPRVCFCVVGETLPIYDGDFTTYFESVVAYGKAYKVEDANEKTKMLMLLSKKYLPEHMDKAEDDIKKSLNVTAVYKIIVEHITGKEKKNQKKSI